MERAKIQLPDEFAFSTELKVRISDINYGGHMGNERILSFIQEARLAYLKSVDMSETDISGVGLIMVDAVVVYKAQAFQGDLLTIAIAARDFDRFGFDLVYRITKDKGTEVARAKTSMAAFNYQKGRMAKLPDSVKKALA